MLYILSRERASTLLYHIPYSAKTTTYVGIRFGARSFFPSANFELEHDWQMKDKCTRFSIALLFPLVKTMVSFKLELFVIPASHF